MGIFFQLRIGVRREHLAVRVDRNTAVCRLLQQELQVVQIMAGHNDKRSGLHGKRHMDRRRLAKAFGVGFVQQRHTLQVDPAELQHERQQLLHAPVLADGEQRFRQKAFDGLVPVAEHHGMIGIGCHAAAAEQQQGLQAADVLLCAPELRQIVVARPAAGRGAGGTVRHKGAASRPGRARPEAFRLSGSGKLTFVSVANRPSIISCQVSGPASGLVFPPRAPDRSVLRSAGPTCAVCASLPQTPRLVQPVQPAVCSH